MGRLFAQARTEGVFAREDALRPEFEPQELIHREAELSEIARALVPATRGAAAHNVFIHGPVGTGKTTAVKKVLKELEEYSESAKGVYVNCWQSNTRQAVFSDVAQALGEVLPRRGIGSDEVFSRIAQWCRREGKALIVVLDEADRVFAKNEESMLYDLSRSVELHGAKISVACISNDAELLANADARIRSSLAPVSVEFKKYSPTQLKDILRERSKIAFAPGACSEEAIALCAAHAAKLGGDARLALETLWTAGRNADSRGSDEVGAEDARSAFGEKEGEWKKQSRLAGATGDEKLVLGILKERGELATGELLAAFSEKKSITERGLRYAIVSLEGKKLVKTRESQGISGRGKTRILSLA